MFENGETSCMIDGTEVDAELKVTQWSNYHRRRCRDRRSSPTSTTSRSTRMRWSCPSHSLPTAPRSASRRGSPTCHERRKAESAIGGRVVPRRRSERRRCHRRLNRSILPTSAPPCRPRPRRPTRRRPLRGRRTAAAPPLKADAGRRSRRRIWHPTAPPDESRSEADVAGWSSADDRAAHRDLARGGVTDVVLALGFKPEPFIEAFPDGRCGDVTLRYAVEPEPLDTGGAIRFAAVTPASTTRSWSRTAMS